MTDFDNTQDKVRECIQLARIVQQAGARVIEQSRDHTDPQILPEQIQEFNGLFAAFQAELDTLGLPDSADRPEFDPKSPGSALMDLAQALESLLKTHQEIIALVQEVGDHTSERLGAIRHAREIFQKFVKPTDDREPRFFDKKG